MLLEIGLLKKQNKRKRKKKKRNKICIKAGLSQVLFLQQKDVICCSNGYIYHFLDYIKLLLFVNANVIHHVLEHIIIIIIFKT